jgi:hypothetical protein
VIGATPSPKDEELSIGYATIRLLGLKPVITQDFLEKVLRRLFGLFALLAVIFGALKTIFEWLDKNELDSAEIFEDEEHAL